MGEHLPKPPCSQDFPCDLVSPKLLPVRHGRQKRPLRSRAHSNPDTHNSGDIRSRGHCRRDPGAQCQLYGSKCSQEFYLYPAHPLKLLYCLPLSTTKFCINFLGLINYIKRGLSEAKCILVPLGPLLGPHLWNHHLSKEVTHIEKSWRQTKENWIFFIDLKVTLELNLLQCRFVKETKIAVSCASFVTHLLKSISLVTMLGRGYNPSSWAAHSLVRETYRKQEMLSGRSRMKGGPNLVLGGQNKISLKKEHLWRLRSSSQAKMKEGLYRKTTCTKALRWEGQRMTHSVLNSSRPEYDMGVVSRPKLKG